MGARLTDADSEALASEFPELICSVARQVIWGTLHFSCSHKLGSGRVEIGGDGPNRLEDSYEIRIDFNMLDDFGCPKVYEESGRLASRAKKAGIELADLHVNKDDKGSCCLGIFPEFHWETACEFLNNYVIPFFYWQTYSEERGVPPWKGFGHGEVGLLEAMSESPDKVGSALSRNQRCPCGSGLKYKKCCLRSDQKLQRMLSSRNSTTRN